MSTRETSVTLIISTDGVTATASPPTRFDGSNAIAATRYSLPVRCATTDTVGVQVSCPSTGTPNGTLTLEGSNDRGGHDSTAQPDVTMTNWSTIGFWSEATAGWLTSLAVSGATSTMLTVPICSHRWLRMKWTNNSGSALLTCNMQIKGDGGR